MSIRAGLFAFFALSLSLSLPITAQGQNLTSPLIVASGKIGGPDEADIEDRTLYAERDGPISRVCLHVYDEAGEYIEP